MRIRLLTAFVGAWLVAVAHAAPYQPGDLTVLVLERGAPAAGIEVTVDGQRLGVTEADGVAEVTTRAGRRSLTLSRGGAELALIDFELRDGDAGEMSVALAGVGRQAGHQFRSLPAPGTLGTISGTITNDAGAALSGARISVADRTESATTGADGDFSLSIPRGVYSVRATHPGMQERRFVDLRALATIGADLTLALRAGGRDESGRIEEVVVVARLSPDTPIAARRAADSVLDVMSERDIAIAGDSTAAAALQRVTGVTVQDDIIFVRGLGDRYSATFFNGAELPSPDPSRRAIGLDIFPASLISGITVQKTYTADLPGDFSGGAVRLQTRSVPDGLSGELKVSSAINTRSAWADGFTHAGGDTDFLGIDDGDRDIPGVASALTDDGRRPLSQLTRAENEIVGEALINNFGFNLRGFELPADLGISANIGNRFQFDNVDLGVSLAGLYDSEWRWREEDRAEIIVDGSNNEFAGEASRLERTENDVDLAGVLNVVADIGFNHTLSFTSLLSRQSRKGTFFENGFNRSDDREFRRVILEFTENELFSNQLSGLHSLPDFNDASVEWQVVYSTAKQDEPGTREYTYSRPEGRDDLPFRLATGPGEAGLPPVLSWEELDEDTLDASMDVTMPDFLFDGIDGDWKFGVRATQRERDFESVRWRFAIAPGAGSNDPLFFPSLSFPSVEMILTPERVGTGGFQVVNASTALAGGNNADNYSGEHDIYAAYLSGDFDLGDFRVQLGVRVEDSDISVGTDAIVGGTGQIGRVEETDVLPSLNVTWFLNDVSQVRFGASQTVNRPQFRELSPAIFRDPNTRFESVGNPNLGQAEVLSLDLRYEHYFSRTEGFSIAAFFKEIDDPIEIVIIGGGSDERGVRTFANADSAELYGIEIDGRYELSFLESVSPILGGFYVSGNAALIESEVKVGVSSLGVGTNNRRELQGQSPWVVNLGLGYTSADASTEAVLLFNMYGERIIEAGINRAPDVKEQPRALLDFNLTQTLFDAFEVGLKLRNILDSEFEAKQGSGTQREYRTGREIQLSVSYGF